MCNNTGSITGTGRNSGVRAVTSGGRASKLVDVPPPSWNSVNTMYSYVETWDHKLYEHGYTASNISALRISIALMTSGMMRSGSPHINVSGFNFNGKIRKIPQGYPLKNNYIITDVLVLKRWLSDPRVWNDAKDITEYRSIRDIVLMAHSRDRKRVDIIRDAGILERLTASFFPSAIGDRKGVLMIIEANNIGSNHEPLLVDREDGTYNLAALWDGNGLVGGYDINKWLGKMEYAKIYFWELPPLKKIPSTMWSECVEFYGMCRDKKTSAACCVNITGKDKVEVTCGLCKTKDGNVGQNGSQNLPDISATIASNGSELNITLDVVGRVNKKFSASLEIIDAADNFVCGVIKQLENSNVTATSPSYGSLKDIRVTKSSGQNASLSGQRVIKYASRVTTAVDWTLNGIDILEQFFNANNTNATIKMAFTVIDIAGSSVLGAAAAKVALGAGTAIAAGSTVVAAKLVLLAATILATSYLLGLGLDAAEQCVVTEIERQKKKFKYIDPNKTYVNELIRTMDKINRK